MDSEQTFLIGRFIYTWPLLRTVMAENQIIDAMDMTIVDGAEELAQELGIDIGAAIQLADIIEFRRNNRSSGRADLIVTVDEEYADWALDAETNVVIVSEMEDYVNKAGENKSYKVYGAATVNQPVMDGEDVPITEALTMIDETDKDFISERGQTWFAKKFVTNIVAFN